MGSGAFVYLVFGGLGIVVVALLLIGKYYPGSGAEVLDWQPTRSAQLEAELEQGDIDQMLDAQNRWRRLRGAPERTLEDLERDLAAQMREHRELQQRLGNEPTLEDPAWPES